MRFEESILEVQEGAGLLENPRENRVMRDVLNGSARCDVQLHQVVEIGEFPRLPLDVELQSLD